jgi:hypothetical protein
MTAKRVNRGGKGYRYRPAQGPIQGMSVALRAEPNHLLVLFLATSGEVTEVFNGPGSIAWAACGPMQRNGQRPIGLSKLRSLMATVEPSARLEVVCG